MVLEKISIIGPGLLGASLGLAARQRQVAGRVAMWGRRVESRRACRERGMCDEAPDSVEKALEGSELAVLCLPVDGIVRFLEEWGRCLPEGLMVTDVGSTKGRICEVAETTLGAGVAFVGSHPMAGSEKSGLEHAQADLYDGRCCLVTPTENTGRQALGRVTAFWQALGMRVCQLSPVEHDRAVARISHLPHFLASSLASFLAGQPGEWSGFAGGGLRDTTRVAAGGTELWASIFEQNREEVLEALEDWQVSVDQLKLHLKNHDATGLRTELERGRCYREGLS